MLEKKIYQRCTNSFLFAFLTLQLLVSCKSEKKTDKLFELPVATVDSGTAVTSKEYIGTIEGKVNVEIRPQVQGALEEINVDEGQFVHKGQRLFKIFDVPYREAVKNAMANQKVEEANLRNAGLEVQRLKPLIDNDVISDVKIKTARSNYDVAKAMLAKSQTAVATAEVNMSYSVIKAPVSGFIGRIPKRLGNVVAPGDDEPITILSDIHEVYVYFTMSESDFLYFNSQHKTDTTAIHHLMPKVYMYLSDGSRYPLQGTIDAVNGQVNNNTGAISLRATFQNPESILRSGGTGKIMMRTYENGAILVPQVAITTIQDRDFVYKLDKDNKVQPEKVVISKKTGNYFIVTSGVQPGDRILTAGFENVAPGQKIKPRIEQIPFAAEPFSSDSIQVATPSSFSSSLPAPSAASQSNLFR